MDRLAYIDQLTSLPNRTRFRRQLAEMIAAAGGRQVVVVRIDVQRLHDVNISAGHAHGDALLVEVSARLHASVPGGLLGRLTGDEFGLAYYRGADQSPEAPLAAMRDRLLQRYDLRGMSVHVSFAIGYTVCADMDAEAAMRQASIATHEAKAAGLGEVRRFAQAIESVILTRTRLTAEMQQSLGGDDFEMHYQPKVDLRTGAMSGAEALVRWNHPVFGQQRPDRFIPLAEQTGLIVELGALAFTKAARMAASVNGPGRRVLPISVNVSLFQFRQVGLLQNFDQALAEAGAQASWLTLELTESVFAGTSPELIEKLHVLRRRGFGLSIDDFGTGYSSLRYLQNFPLTEIKLDRSFVTNIDQNPYGRAITEAVLTIGNGLSVGGRGDAGGMPGFAAAGLPLGAGVPVQPAAGRGCIPQDRSRGCRRAMAGSLPVRTGR
jgi:diguanylate cyclase (GGDEF)-like protein